MRINDLYNNLKTNTISLNNDSSYAAFFTEGSVIEGVVTECDDRKATVLFGNQKENAASFDGNKANTRTVTFPAESVRNAEVGQLRRFSVISATSDKVILKDITPEKSEGGIRKMSVMDVNQSLPQMLEDFEEVNGTKEKEDTDNIRNLSDEDYSALKEEGMNLEKFSSERLERAIERIKNTRALKTETIEKKVERGRKEGKQLVEAAIKRVAKNPAQERIAEALAEADLPITEENVNTLVRTAEQTASIGRLDLNSVFYLVRSEAEPSISNVYHAAHAGSSPYSPIADADWKQLEADAAETVKKAEAELAAENGGDLSVSVSQTDARRLLEHNIPLTKENLKYMKKLEVMECTAERAVKAGIRALKNGKRAEEGLLTDAAAEKEASELAEIRRAVNIAGYISDNAIRLFYRGVNGARNISDRSNTETEGSPDYREISGNPMEADNPSLAELEKIQNEIDNSPSIQSQLSGGMSMKEIDTKLMLEEIRLGMTAEAGHRMLAKGISIATDGLERVVASLRETQREMYRQYFADTDKEAVSQLEGTSEAASLMAETGDALRNVGEAPVQLLGDTFSERHTVTLQYLTEKGRALRTQFLGRGITFEKISSGASLQKNGEPVILSRALTAYENGATEIRHDLGDSIGKAFANIDSLLSENGIEITGANRRAVRILGYNGMEISQENIEEMKYYDAKVTGLVENMTPQVVLEMVGRGINPLNSDIDSLTETVKEIRSGIGYTPEEKFSEFLVRMEENGAVSENERSGYIGIYRLLYQLEKNDGAALGAAVRSGRELTLGNLMTELRSSKRSIDADVDDTTEQTKSHFVNSITGQIAAATEKTVNTPVTDVQERLDYADNLRNRILENTDPARWQNALRDADTGNMTLENLAERLEASAGEASQYEAVHAAGSLIRETAGNNEGIRAFLSAFNVPDSTVNILACAEEFGIQAETLERTDGRRKNRPDNGETAGFSVTKEELLQGLTEESETDELLGIKTRLANSLIGQAFETSATAIAARDLTAQADRLGLLRGLGENGHFRFSVDENEKKANINLTLIRNTGNAGTLSIQLKTEGYTLTSDLSLVIMENAYSVGSAEEGQADMSEAARNASAGAVTLTGQIYCDSRDILPALEEKLAGFKAQLGNAGIAAGTIKLAQGSESGHRYMGKLVRAKEREDKRSVVSTGVLYRAARSFVAAFV